MEPFARPRACGAALAALLLIAGCSTFQAYEGPQRPSAEVATLSPAIMPMRQILIQSIDGRALGALHERVEMLPGPHEIETVVTVFSRSRQAYFTHTLEFSAQAGREYVLYAEFDLYGPRAFILDEQSGSVVAEVTTRTPAPVGARR